jgi:hypothetical protein
MATDQLRVWFWLGNRAANRSSVRLLLLQEVDPEWRLTVKAHCLENVFPIHPLFRHPELANGIDSRFLLSLSFRHRSARLLKGCDVM